MAKKQTAKTVEVVEDDSLKTVSFAAEAVKKVATVKMARYDRAEPIDVPEDQVERYKQSSWKVV